MNDTIPQEGNPEVGTAQMECAPDTEGQEEKWRSQLLAISKEMRALGYTSVFLTSCDDKFIDPDDGQTYSMLVWDGNSMAALGLLTRYQQKFL